MIFFQPRRIALEKKKVDDISDISDKFDRLSFWDNIYDIFTLLHKDELQNITIYPIYLIEQINFQNHQKVI